MSSNINTELQKRNAELEKQNSELQLKLNTISAEVGQSAQTTVADRSADPGLEQEPLKVLSSLLCQQSFISRFCHDLRSPLNAVIGFSQIFKLKFGNGDAEKLLRYIDDIESAGYDILYLVDELHEYANLTTGRTCYNKKTINTEDFIATLHSEAENQIIRNDNEFSITQESPPSEFISDPDRIIQVINVLLHNANKYTEQDKILLHVSSSENGNEIVFSVLDTGKGIPEEDIGDLFNESLQFEHAHTRQHGGVGLGLAIARRTAELINGWIEVDCKVEQGCCFSLFVPLQ